MTIEEASASLMVFWSVVGIASAVVAGYRLARAKWGDRAGQ